jgi:hypothetical protein
MMVLDMGLLIDIRSGKRAATGPGAIIFWLAAGTALGTGTVGILANPLPDSRLYLLVLVGGILGGIVGLYAAWGTSALARVLAIPGIIVDVLIDLVR